jgi:hypothetical protein
MVRADIFSKAHGQGIDISNVCNKALADILGMNYLQQQLDDMPVTRPVIIAQNGSPADGKVHVKETHPIVHTPVINADDPASSTNVRSAKRQPKTRPSSQETGSAPPPLTTPDTIVPSSSTAPAEKIKKTAGAKAHKDEGLKKFVATKIARSDTGDAVISKDDMYQAFTRFCRENKFAPVPDRKAFTLNLKNKFAFFDKTVNGIPSWVNVRFQ